MGWIASGFTIAGVAVLPKHMGYWLLLVGNWLWFVEGVRREAYDLVVLNLILAFLTYWAGSKACRTS